MRGSGRRAACLVMGLAAVASAGCGDGTPAGPSCTYTLSRTSVAIPPGGGTDSVTVTTGRSCSWSASSDASWLAITSATHGKGSAAVAFAAAANPSVPRGAVLTVAGQTVAVTQDALRFTLSGTVTDVFLGTGPRGDGLSGVAVTVSDGPGSGSALTDWRGRYAIEGLLAGRYQVAFAKNAYQPAATSVQLDGDASLSMTLALEVPAAPTESDLTGYWSGEGSYPNAPFKLVLIHEGATLHGTYADRHDQGTVDLSSSPPPPLPPSSPGRFTLAVHFGDAILYLECEVEDGRRIIGAQRTSALGWTRTFPFTMTR